MKKLLLIAAFCLVKFLAAQNQMPTAQQIRQSIAGEIKSFNIPPAAIFKVENRVVVNGKDSIPIRIYYPKAGKKLRIIYHVHGGALVAGDLETHENICRVLANNTKSIVVAIDYRKPPEFPYPASINDCEFVLEWIKKMRPLLAAMQKIWCCWVTVAVVFLRHRCWPN